MVRNRNRPTCHRRPKAYPPPGYSLDGSYTDGRVESSGAVFESKFMLPWSFSEEAAAEIYAAQLQHNMFVIAAKTAVLSVSPAAAGLKSRPMPIRSTNTSLLQPRENSGVALKLATTHPVWRRSTEAADRGRTHRRHDFIERLGRTRGSLHPNTRR